MTQREHLTRLDLKDGTHIEVERTEDHDLVIEHEGHSVTVPKATGRLTLDLMTLLAPFGTFEETDDE